MKKASSVFVGLCAIGVAACMISLSVRLARQRTR